MLVFENAGEIDPRLITTIGVSVKESTNPIGFFGTGLKYAIACLLRWKEEITIQSGINEFIFSTETAEIRGQKFDIVNMHSKYDTTQLGFTTELGKRWEPWMVYRELWCNAQDEPDMAVYETVNRLQPRSNTTRIIVDGSRIKTAHEAKNEFILDTTRNLLHSVDGLEIYEGKGNHVFYRGIAVQKPDKPSLYTYNITEHIYLTEDRTAGSWTTDPIIARGLTKIDDKTITEDTLTAPAEVLESRLDYDYARDPSEAWLHLAEHIVSKKPFDVPASVRGKFVKEEVKLCPTCGREME